MIDLRESCDIWAGHHFIEDIKLVIGVHATFILNSRVFHPPHIGCLTCVLNLSDPSLKMLKNIVFK